MELNILHLYPDCMSLDGEYAPSARQVDIENRRQALTMLL